MAGTSNQLPIIFRKATVFDLAGSAGGVGLGGGAGGGCGPTGGGGLAGVFADGGVIGGGDCGSIFPSIEEHVSQG